MHREVLSMGADAVSGVVRVVVEVGSQPESLALVGVAAVVYGLRRIRRLRLVIEYEARSRTEKN